MSTGAQVDEAQVRQVMGSLMADVAASAGLLMTQLGIRCGLWREMAGAGGLSPAELSHRCGVATPYVREWLRHQAASGYLEYDEATDRFTLPAPVAAVLAGGDYPAVIDSFAQLARTVSADAALVEHAFRTGAGVAWRQRSTKRDSAG